jgi:hypothetical protein
MKIPLVVKRGVLIFNLLTVGYYLIEVNQKGDSNFVWIALCILVTYIVLACYSIRWTRIACFSLILSNLIWIVLREILDVHYHLKGNVDLRYDNDIYHFLMIISTSFVFYSIYKGDWKYPKKVELI